VWCVRLCLSFVFTSRRRHTRFSRDWSSDVCSSDLTRALAEGGIASLGRQFVEFGDGGPECAGVDAGLRGELGQRRAALEIAGLRSEERRVGKEGRSWCASRK